MERIDPETNADERAALAQFLDYHRATLLGKAAGLDQAQLATTTAASSLHLAGLLKHMALVEDSWFRVTFLGDQPAQWWRDVDWESDPDWEFRTAAKDDPAELRALYQQACERSRAAVDAADSLDQRSVRKSRRRDETFNLRWILLHMIEETARHNGHADLIREAIDGQTGE
ncbi:MAG: DinB family protein [Euzebyaceae bacterium]|nr:DinB family protein [Euzebyaceae bacterium]